MHLQWQIDAMLPPRLLEVLKEMLVGHAAEHAGEYVSPPSCSYTGTAGALTVLLATRTALLHGSSSSGDEMCSCLITETPSVLAVAFLLPAASHLA